MGREAGEGAAGGRSGVKLDDGESGAESGSGIGGSLGVVGIELNGSSSDISSGRRKSEREVNKFRKS